MDITSERGTPVKTLADLKKVPRPIGLRKYEPLKSQLFEDIVKLSEGMSNANVIARLRKDEWTTNEINEFLSYRELLVHDLDTVRKRMWKGWKW